MALELNLEWAEIIPSPDQQTKWDFLGCKAKITGLGDFAVIFSLSCVSQTAHSNDFGQTRKGSLRLGPGVHQPIAPDWQQVDAFQV